MLKNMVKIWLAQRLKCGGLMIKCEYHLWLDLIFLFIEVLNDTILCLDLILFHPPIYCFVVNHLITLLPFSQDVVLQSAA